MNIANLSIKRPTLVVVVFAILTLLGIYGYRTMNYELMPKFTSPVFTVLTVYPGASPKEVENSVTKKIEDALSNLENIETIRSISQESVSMVIIELKFGSDLDYLLQEAQRKVNAAVAELPESVLDPVVTKYSMDDFPVMNIGVNADAEATTLFDIVRHQIKPEISRLEGVGEVSIIGGTEREIQVNVDAAKLATFKISLLQVLQTVKQAGIEFPAGNLEQHNRKVTIRISSRYKNLDDLKNLVIMNLPDGSFVKLEDIAEVRDNHKDVKSIYRINGMPAIGLSIKKQADANAVEVSELVREKLAELESAFSNIGIEFSIPDDTSLFTLEAAAGVIHDLFNAVILVTLIMLIFLHSIRNAIIVMISVPVSLVSSFIAMMLFGYTLNLMTLLALSLIIGILVDDAIVVLENIYRHLEMGKNRVQATKDGVKEISITVISTTLVLVVVFLPVALAPSLIGPILRPYSVVIVFSVLLSMLVAFTIVPLLTSRFSKIEKYTHGSPGMKMVKWFESGIDNFGRWIHKLLVISLRHKGWALALTTLAFLLSLALIPGGFIGSEFINQGDMGKFIIQVELPRDARIEQTNHVVREIEKILSEKKYVTGIFSTIGSNNEFLSIQGGENRAEVTVTLVNAEVRDVSSNKYAHKIKNELIETIPGVKFQTAIVSIVGGSDVAPIQVVVESSNQDSLVHYAGIFKNAIENIPGCNDTELSYDEGNPEIVLELDKEKMARYGLSMAMVGPVIQTAFSGNSDASYNDGPYDYNINVRLDEFNRNSLDDVSGLTFMNIYGHMIQLSQFADIYESTGSSKLERYSRIPSVMIESQVLGRPGGDVTDDIKEKLEALNIPEEVSFTYEGDMKYQAEAFQSLGFAFIASIILVYLIMVALYESYIYPLVVLFSVPLSVIGALLALALTRNSLSIFSLLGMIMLVGIVLKNAILIVDFANQKKKEGYSSLRAIITATNLRLRPILMTSLSLIIGLLPLALASGSASEWKNGLAWVVIGGLTSSMLLTLVIIPVIFNITDNLKSRLFKKQAVFLS